MIATGGSLISAPAYSIPPAKAKIIRAVIETLELRIDQLELENLELHAEAEFAGYGIAPDGILTFGN